VSELGAETKKQFKFKCPKCDSVLTEKYPTCPKCGAKFNWGQATKKSAKKRDKTSDNMLKFFYLYKTLALVCPIFGLIILILNKEYKTNIKRQKQEYYARYKRAVIKYAIGWGVAIVIIIVYCAILFGQAT
jgi:uncharacterized membrane protein YvbJ